MRRLALVLAGAAALGLYGTATASAAPPPVARPNPALVEVHLDYVGQLEGPSGRPAVLGSLDPAVVAVAVADQQYLAYQTTHDLGGFAPAPVGQLAVSSGGRNVVGATIGTPQIPQLAQAAGGQVSSFAAVGGSASGPPESGTQPVPGLGVPPPVIPPTNSNTVPPPNQGFGGQTPPPTTTTTTTTTPAEPPTTTTAPAPRPKPPPTTTTTPTTTTVPTTTTAPTTTAPPPEPPPAPPPSAAPSGASCGTVGFTITSDHSSCSLYAVNMAPGGSVSEVMTIRNDSSQAYTVSLRAAGTANRLWHDLQLGVWEEGTAAPTPFPALDWWTAQENALATLAPGASIRLVLELVLPTDAGNADQGLRATVDLVWRAQG